jgi:outer membrane protein assembly factor BamB
VALFCSVNAIACVPPVRVGPDRQESGWPAYLGTPRHDVSAAETLNPDPRPLWRVDVGRAVVGSPALGETILAAGTTDRAIVLVDRASGEVLWRQRVGGTVRAGPLLDQDRLYAGTEATPDGKVYALRLKTGKPLWSTPLGSVAAPLALDGDALFAATEEGLVARLDPETGVIAWRQRLAGAVRAGPVPAAGHVLVATTADTLYLLARETGDVRARLATPEGGAVLGTPVVDGTSAFAATTDGHVLALSLPALTVVWDRPVGDAVLGSPALSHDTLYVLTRNGRLWLIPLATPNAARVLDLAIVAVAGPTPVSGGVLVGSVAGEVLYAGSEDGRVRWRAQVDGPINEPPLVRDRVLFVVAGRGDIHAYR